MMLLTNALNVAFTATLLSVNDAGVTLAFPEDGATNTLAWAQLAPVSRDAVCAATNFMPLPPNVIATFKVALRGLKQIAIMEEEGRLDFGEVSARRRAVISAFEQRVRAKGLDEAQVERLRRRLLKEEFK